MFMHAICLYILIYMHNHVHMMQGHLSMHIDEEHIYTCIHICISGGLLYSDTMLASHLKRICLPSNEKWIQSAKGTCTCPCGKKRRGRDRYIETYTFQCTQITSPTHPFIRISLLSSPIPSFISCSLMTLSFYARYSLPLSLHPFPL